MQIEEILAEFMQGKINDRKSQEEIKELWIDYQKKVKSEIG